MEPYGWPPPPRANWLLLGHEAAESEILNCIHSGRLPHAWLICGARGIGKATLAFRFARYLLAGSGAGESAASALPGEGLLREVDQRASEPMDGLAIAPDRPLFHRVASGGHADLFTVERRINEKTGRLRSEIVVEDVRSVVAFLAHTAAEGGWRAVVVDAAENLNRSAANALLKVLEEPPPQTVLLLVSHNPGCLLPTIRSRCRRLLLKAPAVSVGSDLLARYRPDLHPDQAHALLKLADDSIGIALALADADGLAVRDDVVGAFAALPKLDMTALGRLGDRVTRAGLEDSFPVVKDVFARLLSRIVRAAALAGSGAEPAMGVAEDQDIVDRLAARASLDRWLEVWDNTSGLLARVEGANLDRRQVILDLFLTLRSAVRS
ncbi:MAG: DNA polymerase III subunit delta' [Rhodospirillales bacterium]|nr:DNA polymerase III subunit delta' [Rhodospirillales bacterium]